MPAPLDAGGPRLKAKQKQKSELQGSGRQRELWPTGASTVVGLTVARTATTATALLKPIDEAPHGQASRARRCPKTPNQSHARPCPLEATRGQAQTVPQQKKGH